MTKVDLEYNGKIIAKINLEVLPAKGDKFEIGRREWLEKMSKRTDMSFVTEVQYIWWIFDGTGHYVTIGIK